MFKEDRVNFNPVDLNDEMALKTQWTPCKRGGTNFGTHKFQLINHNRAEFKTKKGAVLFSVFFILVGLICCFSPLIMHFLKQK